jgi:hypothetical protein
MAAQDPRLNIGEVYTLTGKGTRIKALNRGGGGSYATDAYDGMPGDGIQDERGALLDWWTTTVPASGGSAHLSPGTHLVGSDLTFEYHNRKGLNFAPGAILKPAAGVTITINAPIKAGAYRIFDTSAGGAIVLGERAAVRCWPEWWGAEPDTTADQSVYVQKAVDAGPPVGLLGIYGASASIWLRSGLVMEGRRGTGFKLVAGIIAQTILRHDNDTPITDISLKGFELDGNKDLLGGYAGSKDLLRGNYWDRFEIEDLYVHDAAVEGLHITRSHNGSISFCDFERIGHNTSPGSVAILLGGGDDLGWGLKNIRVVGCNFRDFTDGVEQGGILIETVGGSLRQWNVEINGGTFENVNGTCVQVLFAQGVVVKGMTMLNCGGASGKGVDFQVSKDCLVYGCTIIGQLNDSISIRDECEGVYADHNVIVQSSAARAIRVTTNNTRCGARSNRITVTNASGQALHLGSSGTNGYVTYFTFRDNEIHSTVAPLNGLCQTIFATDCDLGQNKFSSTVAVNAWKMAGESLRMDLDGNQYGENVSEGLVTSANLLRRGRLMRRSGGALVEHSLSNLMGLSKGMTPARNLWGEVTISGTDTSALVTFPTPEPNSSYRIVPFWVSETGAVPTGARHGRGANPTTSNFEMGLEAAPGAGNSVTIGWLLLR